jgi:hypothetical protein
MLQTYLRSPLSSIVGGLKFYTPGSDSVSACYRIGQVKDQIPLRSEPNTETSIGSDRTLNQFRLLSILRIYFSTIHFNIIVPSSRFRSGRLPEDFYFVH